jgi:hypothetical protein
MPAPVSVTETPRCSVRGSQAATTDRARRCEFDRIADQVEQDLTHPVGIDHQGRGESRGNRTHAELKLQVLGPRLGREQRQRRAAQVLQIGRLRADRDLTGLQLGEVEDVVDGAQQGAAGVVDAPDIIAHRRRQVGLFGGQIGEADDAGQGRAQLVAHIGQKLGFDGGGLFGGDDGGALIGHVLEDAEQGDGTTVAIELAIALGQNAAQPDRPPG